MKKAFTIILALIIVMFCVISCTVEIVSEIPLDVDFVAAYDTMETVHEYVWDWYHMDYKLLPVSKKVHYEAVYKVKYLITYADGSERTEWREVERMTYEAAKNELGMIEESEDME